MNRKHTLNDYLNIVEKLKKRNKFIKFSSDFIVAYPGETEKDFEDTVSLIKKVKFINSYSFIYSQRPGTPAAELNLVNSKVAKTRLLNFQKIAAEIKKKYRKTIINSSAKVLFENKLKDQDKYFGRDEYLNSVIVSSKTSLVGKIINIKIKSFNHNTLFGDFVDGMNVSVA